MPTNAEYRTQITELQKQLRIDVINLEKKFKDDKAALERKCSQDIANLERQIKEGRAQELREAQQRIWQVIEGTGLDPATILEALPRTRGPRKSSTIVHRGPDGQIWNGRGRTPRWFKTQQGSSAAHPAASSGI